MSADETCPVCGQEYVHKREEGADYETTVLRGDYTECVVTRHHSEQHRPNVAYVHDTQRTVVSQVKRKDTDERSPLARILGWDK